MKRMRLAILLCALIGWSTPAFSQATNIGSGATLPAACLVGDVYAKTGTAAGIYVCLATNTWTAGGGASPAGSSGNLQTNNGSGGLGAYTGTTCSAKFARALDANGAATCEAVANADLAGSIAASKLVGTDIATVGTITTGTWQGTRLGVTFGGTGLTSGTSGGILAFTGSGTIASSPALTANMPVIGGGAGATPTVGTVSGNTTKFVTMSGSVTSGNCVKADASGNLIDFGGACGGSGSPGGADTQVQFNDSSSFGGDAGFVFNKTTNDATLTGIIKSAGQNNAYVTKTSTYTAGVTDGTIECLTNAFTVNLPTAVGIQGRMYTIKNLQSANTCTVDPAGSETVDGAATLGVANGAVTIQSDNANWRTISAEGISVGALAQGDLLYASATNVLSSLTKDANATRYLSNTGSNNNPAWALVNVANGVTGVLPAANGGTGANGTIALPQPLIWMAGVSQAGTGSISCNLPSSGAATAGTAATSVPPVGVASFSGSASNEMHCMFITPADWTASSAMDITLYWRAASITGSVNWKVATLFVGDGVALNTAYNTASTVADAAKGTTLQVNTATISGVTATGTTAIGANKLSFVDILRDGGVGADTMTGAAELIGFVITIRRTVTIGG